MKKPSNVEVIKYLAQSALAPLLKSFSEQLAEYNAGIYPKGEFLVVALRSNFMPYYADLPLLIKQRVLHKLHHKHELDNALIANIPSLLAEAVFSFESGNDNNSVIFVCDYNSKPNSNLIIVIKVAIAKGLYMVNELSSVHYRDIEAQLKKAIANEKMIFVGAKTSEWAKQFEALSPLLESYCSAFSQESQTSKQALNKKEDDIK